MYESEGWFYSEKWHVHQKVNDKVYVYVSKIFSGWQVQLYGRGDVSMCTLEARTNEVGEKGFTKMIELGDEWLTRYGNDVSEINQNFFHISEGEAWTKEGKQYWI